MRNGTAVATCGIVTVRQQPETAKGTMFVSLEDETGSTQVIVWKDVKAAFRVPLLNARLMGVRGRWQVAGDVRNVIAREIVDLSEVLGELRTRVREFR